MAKSVNKESISLTKNQLSHLIYGTVRNLDDLKTNDSKNGFKFLLILEPLVVDGCIEADEVPESDEDFLDIAACHGVLELYEFFEEIGSMTNEKNKYFRFFTTVDINSKNMGSFVNCLADIDENWAQRDLQIEAEEDLQGKLEGKNLVDGNNTLN